MKTKAEVIFKSKEAIRLYNKMKYDSDIYQCGLDEKGKIYFAWLNGNIDRYTRPQFLKMAKQELI